MKGCEIVKKLFLSIAALLLILASQIFATPLLAPTDVQHIALIYHRLTDDETTNSYTITTKDFEDDIQYFLSNGYTFCTASELDKVNFESNINEKYVAITFDDGYSSCYWLALPILEKYKVKATFFIVGSMLNQPYYMTSRQVTVMSESEYVEIGNHTYSLHNYSPTELRTIYISEPNYALEDYKRNNELLTNIIGKDIKAVAYPYGEYRNYINYALTSEGLTTFSSDEYLIGTNKCPYPRINRSDDLTPATILDRQVNKSVNLYKKTY